MTHALPQALLLPKENKPPEKLGHTTTKEQVVYTFIVIIEHHQFPCCLELTPYYFIVQRTQKRCGS
jgi:hypothetical protein